MKSKGTRSDLMDEGSSVVRGIKKTSCVSPHCMSYLHVAHLIVKQLFERSCKAITRLYWVAANDRDAHTSGRGVGKIGYKSE